MAFPFLQLRVRQCRKNFGVDLKIKAGNLHARLERAVEKRV